VQRSPVREWRGRNGEVTELCHTYKGRIVRCVALDIVVLHVITVHVQQAKIPSVEIIVIGTVLSIVREVNMHVGHRP
jgi:hypothetical protein